MAEDDGGGITERRTRDRIVEFILSAVIIFVPLFPILSPRFHPGINDWEHTLWGVGYTATYFSRHVAFPAVFNTDWVAGQTTPIFYAPLLYPTLTPLAVVFDANWSVRLAVLGLWVMQFVLVRRLVWLASGSRVTAVVVAGLMCWAVYP